MRSWPEIGKRQDDGDEEGGLFNDDDNELRCMYSFPVPSLTSGGGLP